MNPLEAFSKYKQAILQELSKSKARLQEGSFLTEEADTLFDILIEYSSRGKMIRGGLVLQCWEYMGDNAASASLTPPRQSIPTELLQLAASMELLQSFLLIHDDFMDRDETRRGGPALHMQLRNPLWRPWSKQTDTQHLGSALAICAGDIAQFWALQLFNQAVNGRPKQGELSALLANELLHVGIAQFQDVLWSGQAAIPESGKILEMYENKTGRYTFALPILAAGYFAGIEDHLIQTLSTIANIAGKIFQIRDDEINLWGNPEKTGKPRGSDLREKKKTLALSLLETELRSSKKAELQNLDFDASYQALESLDIRNKLEEARMRLQNDAESELEILANRGLEGLAQFLNNLVIYCGNREF